MDISPEKEAEALKGDLEEGEKEGGSRAGDMENDSPSGSSSDSEADNDGVELQVETLERTLAENPANYDAHVQYIHCLRKLGHIEKLRQARRAMNTNFPLSPHMRLEWAKDESSLNKGPEALSIVEEIYEKGVHEYLSVRLWCDYINFIQEHDPLVAQCSPSVVSKMRDLFERALTAAGLHFAEGHMIWDTYREFEQAIYLTIDDGNNEEKAKQISRIRALFHRQLAVPLADMKSTLLCYKNWEVELGNINDIDSDELDALPSNVSFSHKKALEMYSARLPYEDKLSKEDVSDAKLQIFMNYIKFEESSGDPARVQVIYERAISDFPISSEIWLGYTSYLDQTLKVPSVLKDVYSRATRNCTWVGTLWVRYLLSLERIHAPEKELSVVFEKSLQSIFSSINEYLDLFLTRIDGLRRRISLTPVNEEGLEYALIRDTFQRAADYLSPDLAEKERLLQLHTYWARLEASLGKDLIAARGVWESLIKKSGPMVEVWKAYIDMEISMGNINEVRSIYKRCYSKRLSGNGSEDVCYSWLRFEREFGSLDDLDLATKKVMHRLEELRIFKAQQESKSVASLTAQKDYPPKAASLKRKMTKVPSGKQSPAKRQKAAGSKLEHEHEVKESVDEFDAGKVVRLDTPASVTNAIDEKDHQNLVKDSSSAEAIQREVRKNFYTDQCTAFVSNVSLEANEEHIRKFFNGSGGVTAIRLLKDKFTGRSRGLAYVDFLDQEHLSAAIAKNKQKLLGQRLSVARSDPKQNQKKASVHGRGGQAHSESNPPTKRENIKTSDQVTWGTVPHRRGGHVQLIGKNTFAMPRNVARPLGWSVKELKPEESEELPKSNDEFRKMLLKE